MFLESVPFNRPYVPKELMVSLLATINSGHLSGDGPASRLSQEKLSAITGGSQHFLTPSCSHALELAIRALGIGSGDEVILPSFNFTSAGNAIVLAGAKPVFVDVDKMTFCLDLDKVREAVTPRTKAIIAVHYGGVGANISNLAAFCESNSLSLIEDNAHGLGGMWGGVLRHVWNFFHPVLPRDKKHTLW